MYSAIAAASSLCKQLSMAESCLTLIPRATILSTASVKYPFISPTSRPVNFAFSTSLSSWVSLKTSKFSPFSLAPLVAQTSGWAQQEEETEEGTGEGAVGLVEEDGIFGDGSDEESYPEPPEEAKVFVGNLPYDVDSAGLAELFNQAGVVEIAEVIYHRETDKSRGFGFVTMSTVEEAEKAVEKFHRYDLNGRFLTVNKAAPRGSQPERPQAYEPAYRIYVGNLPWQVDDARLEQVFSEHGTVINAQVVYDRETGRSRGFGFVTMASETELNDAIAALDGELDALFHIFENTEILNLDGRSIRVNVAEERPRRGFF